MRVFVSLSRGEQVYDVNGVRYVVGSRFAVPKTDKATITDRLNSCIKSDFIHLLTKAECDTMDMENVCSAAGKEE